MFVVDFCALIVFYIRVLAELFFSNCSLSKFNFLACELRPPDPFLQAFLQWNAAYVLAQQGARFAFHDLCLLVAG